MEISAVTAVRLLSIRVEHLFFGNAEMHPCYSSIKELCSKNKIEIKILCKNMPLTDVGGIVKLF